MIIAVDFDGTIVEHRFPDIGRVRPFAFETLLKLQKKKTPPDPMDTPVWPSTYRRC